jgi:hypothetical protein
VADSQITLRRTLRRYGCPRISPHFPVRMCPDDSFRRESLVSVTSATICGQRTMCSADVGQVNFNGTASEVLGIQSPTPDRKSTCFTPPLFVRWVTFPVCGVKSSSAGIHVCQPRCLPKVLARSESPMKSASAVTPEARLAGRSTWRLSAQNAKACPPTNSPREEQMLKILRTSSGVRGASVARSLLIEIAREPKPRRPGCN